MFERRSAAIGRLASHITAEAGPEARTLVVGAPDQATLVALEATLAPLTVVRGLGEAPEGSCDVGVALDWLHRLDDPGAGLAALARVAPAHLLLAAPREPFARLGVTLRPWVRTSWSTPGFLRFVSDHGAVRDVAHPLGETLVWVRPTSRARPARSP